MVRLLSLGDVSFDGNLYECVEGVVDVPEAAVPVLLSHGLTSAPEPVDGVLLTPEIAAAIDAAEAAAEAAEAEAPVESEPSVILPLRRRRGADQAG